MASLTVLRWAGADKRNTGRWADVGGGMPARRLCELACARAANRCETPLAGALGVRPRGHGHVRHARALQLNVARDKGRAEGVRSAPTQPVADVAAVLIPHGSFPHDGDGRRITATGRYDGSGQVLVTPRLLRGKPGYWVVTPLVVRSTGARIAVVRGFVTDPAQAIAPDRGTEVTVSGTLAPGESPAGDGAHADPALADGQLTALDLSLLVNRWPGTLYNAFVFATAEAPDLTSVASPA